MSHNALSKCELEQSAEELELWWVQEGPSHRFRGIESKQRELYVPYEPKPWDQEREWDRQAQEQSSLAEREALKRKPQNVPEGYVLVTLARGSHSDGYTYDWRYVTVPKGKSILGPFSRGWTVINEESKIFFLDCNADYYFKLPKGSFEFVDGRWFSRRKVRYGY